MYALEVRMSVSDLKGGYLQVPPLALHYEVRPSRLLSSTLNYSLARGGVDLQDSVYFSLPDDNQLLCMKHK